MMKILSFNNAGFPVLFGFLVLPIFKYCIFDGGDSTTQNFVDERTTGADNGSQAFGDQNTVFNTKTDFGAISQAFGLANNSLDSIESVSDKSLTFAGNSVDGAFNLSAGIVRDLIGSHDQNISQAIQFAEDSSQASNEFAATVANPNQEAQKDIVKNLAIGLAVLGLGLAFMKFRK